MHRKLPHAGEAFNVRRSRDKAFAFTRGCGPSCGHAITNSAQPNLTCRRFNKLPSVFETGTPDFIFALGICDVLFLRNLHCLEPFNAR